MGGIVSSPFVRLPLASLTFSTSEFAYKKPMQFGFEGNPTIIGDSSDPNAAAKRAAAGSAVLSAPLGAPPTDGADPEARRRAQAAADVAPLSASSVLTDEVDPNDLKRKRLLGE